MSDARRRVGLAVASVPVALFLLSAAFIALRAPAERPGACRHDHSADQVRAWWERAQENDVAVPGTRYVALDEPDGRGPVCIRVELDDPQARTHLERRFRRLEVPAEVIVYQRAGAEDRKDFDDGGER